MKPRGNLRRHGSAPAPSTGVRGNYREHWEFRATINGVVRHTRLHKIIAEYAIGEIIDWQTDPREIHHVDGDQVNNNKPSNLQIVKNRRQHKWLDLCLRCQKLAGLKPFPVRLRDTVYVGDILRDDDYDIENYITWWCETMELL